MHPLFITKANYISDYNIELFFSDGTSGIVNLEPYIEKGIFKTLQDKEFFKNFSLNSWTIEWQNGADFSPEFLYEIAEKNLATSI